MNAAFLARDEDAQRPERIVFMEAFIHIIPTGGDRDSLKVTRGIPKEGRV